MTPVQLSNNSLQRKLHYTYRGKNSRNVIILMMATYKVTLEVTEEQKNAINKFIRLNKWTMKVTEERITDNVHVASELPDVTAGNHYVNMSMKYKKKKN